MADLPLGHRSSPAAKPGDPHQNKTPAGADPEANTAPEQADEDLWSLADVLAFFGGSNKPLHYSTLYRGIEAGRYPKPVHPSPNVSRWLPSRCRAARQKLIDAPHSKSRRGRRSKSELDPGVE